MNLALKKYIINRKRYDITIYYFSNKLNSKYIPPVWILHDQFRKRYFMCGQVFFIQHFLDRKFYKNGFKSKNNAFSKLKTLLGEYESIDKKTKKKLALLDPLGNEYKKNKVSEFKHLYENFRLKTTKPKS